MFLHLIGRGRLRTVGCIRMSACSVYCPIGKHWRTSDFSHPDTLVRPSDLAQERRLFVDLHSATQKDAMQITRQYRFQLLAPSGYGFGHKFRRFSADRQTHRNMLDAARQLRGAAYLADGAISACDLDAAGRFCMEDDDQCWHLLLLDTNEHVIGCIRYVVYPTAPDFCELQVRHSPIFKGSLAAMTRSAVERDLQLARINKLAYVEIGGWAIDSCWRHTRAAADCLAASYALGELWGGSLGICTATVRHGSACMLQRFGALPLSVEGQTIGRYSDPRFRCDMHLLRFDRTSGWRFASVVEPLKRELAYMTVTTAGKSRIDIPASRYVA